jgi:cell division septation protein DedD
MTRSAVRRVRAAFVPALALIVILAGCAGSSEGTAGGGGARALQNQAGGASARPATPDFPPGKFTVQLGAYQSEDGASKIAALARSRFTRDVYTVFNDTDALYKVMLGVFDTKEEARNFRDTIVRQFPADYRDAWVSDLAK